MKNNSKLKSFSLSNLLLSVIILFLIGYINIVAEDTIIPSQSIDDGPYMFIVNDTTLSVYYMWDNELIIKEFYGSDTIFVKGFGYDSLSSYKIPVIQSNNKKSIFSNVTKIFTFSDPHGEFENLSELLKVAEVIDDDLDWNFGAGHLVVDGDIFDRGDKINEILWLIYKLEQQSEAAGGKVHYILGNHEVMPLQKDLRYINDMYFLGICEKTGKTYDQLYDNTTVIGRWLRSKNFVEKINNIIFVHGGLSPQMIEYDYSINDINQIMRQNLDTPRSEIKSNDSLSALFSKNGPIWFRGFHEEMEGFTHLNIAQIDSLLDFYNAEHIVVGHSILDSVTALYNGKVFGVNKDYEIRDEFEGLLWENGQFISIDINGIRKLLLSGTED